MLGQQRRAFISERVRRDGAVRVAALVEELDVSDMTVRRDLDLLERDGFVVKVHGGATVPGGLAAVEPHFADKETRNRSHKAAIAAVAARLVPANAAVGISAGSTTAALASELLDTPGLTVVTNSIRVADVMHRSTRTDQTVILTGGTRTPSDALVGPVAVATLRSLHLDLVILGVHGMDEKSGFTTPNLAESDTNRRFVDAARRLVVIADHTKWGVAGISTFARLSDADVLITDSDLSSAARDVLGEAVGDLICVATNDRERQSG